MLVGHDAVESHLVGQRILFVVLVVKHARPGRVEVGVGEAQAARLVLFEVLIGHVAVGLFGKVVNLYLIFGPG